MRRDLVLTKLLTKNFPGWIGAIRHENGRGGSASPNPSDEFQEKEVRYQSLDKGDAFSQGSLHHVGPFLWTTSDLRVIGSALLIAGLLYALLQRTRFGKAVRAISEDRALAQVSGIPARRVVMQAWGLAGALAGFSGFALAETIGTFGPSLGFSFLLLTITASVAGGIGRPYATLGGAVVVGLAVELAGAYTSSAYQNVYGFGLLVVLMLALPNGIFVRRSAVAVRA